MVATFAALGIGTYYVRHYAIHLAVILILLFVIRRFRSRLPSGLRVAGVLIVVVMSVRLVLFDNPGMLRLYQHALTSESLGLRQWGVLDLEIRKYRRDIHQPRLANLAVGSSQVGAIFYQWASPPPEPVDVYSLAGMKTLDLVLNEDAIAAFNPARIILYMSAFDMTGSPELFSLPLAPPQPRTMWPIYRRLRASGLGDEDTAPSLHAYVVSQVLPEYRYSFVYRALLKQWLGTLPKPAATSPQRLPEFSSYFDPQWLDYNFMFFRDFLTFCQARGIDVLIAEGQINPSARTPAIDALNTEVRARIAALGREFPVVRYVPAAEIYEFSSDEYHDMTHVLPDAAKRYTAKLSAYLVR